MGKKENAFIAGGIVAILGLYLLFFHHDLLGGLIFFGIGVVIMASVSKAFRKKVFEFFFILFLAIVKIFRTIVKILKSIF